jgi:hypothetical protein
MKDLVEEFVANTVVDTDELNICVDCNYADWKTAHGAEDPIYFCVETSNDSFSNDGFACLGLNAEEAIKIADALYDCVRKLKDVEPLKDVESED